MSRYRVTGIAQVEVVTFVEASDYKEAEKIASERDLDICIHGSEMNGCEDEEEFTLTDGSYFSIENLSAEEDG